MPLTKYKLGNLIEPYNEKCENPNLTVWDVSGINSDKEFFEPARQVGADTSNYKIVPPNYFACNLMHVGRDKVLPIAMNHTTKNKIVSPAYAIFKINEDVPVIRDYFFILLKSAEKDRYFWFHTDSSVRDGMSWDDFCDMELDLPSVEIQKKYVDIYNAMIANQQCYETGLDDLKLVCDAYIEKLRREISCCNIGSYIAECTERNSNLVINNVQGVNNNNNFIETRANIIGIDLQNYKIVRKGQFAYNPSRINLGSIALLSDDDCIVSPMYIVFKVVYTNILLPEYLMMWLSRSEFYRSTLFYASGSVRDTFDFNIMKEVKIPIPKLKIQEDIVNIYSAYQLRKEINKNLKEQIRNICPILIKGSIDEGKAERRE